MQLEMQPAIEALQRSRDEIVKRCEREVAAIDAAIRQLRQQRAKDSGQENGQAIRPGQYKGMAITPALASYLAERESGPVSIQRAIDDLRAAGADLGSPERAERNVRITITNNHKLFRKDDGDMVTLVGVLGRRPKKKKHA